MRVTTTWGRGRRLLNPSQATANLSARSTARSGSSRRSSTYLDSAAQITALLDAAGELDKGTRADRQHIHRRAQLAALIFAGLRIGEFLALRSGNVDLAGGWITVRASKTDAGRRKVKIRPVLRDVLLAHKPLDASSGAYVFATAQGKRLHLSNVRVRVLAKAVERANGRLEDGGPPLPRLTPHSLRRTFASLLYAIGDRPRRDGRDGPHRPRAGAVRLRPGDAP